MPFDNKCLSFSRTSPVVPEDVTHVFHHSAWPRRGEFCILHCFQTSCKLSVFTSCFRSPSKAPILVLCPSTVYCLFPAALLAKSISSPWSWFFDCPTLVRKLHRDVSSPLAYFFSPGKRTIIEPAASFVVPHQCWVDN